MSSAGGPLAVVLLVLHVHRPPCQALRVHGTGGPLGACLQSLPEGGGAGGSVPLLPSLGLL